MSNKTFSLSNNKLRVSWTERSQDPFSGYECSHEHVLEFDQEEMHELYDVLRYWANPVD